MFVLPNAYETSTYCNVYVFYVFYIMCVNSFFSYAEKRRW